MANSERHIPLADRLRPTTFAEFFGQPNLSDEQGIIFQGIQQNRLPSLIFWGPPGTGKTTLALIIARQLKAEFIKFSAVTEGVRDLRKVLDRARANKLVDKSTILFIDEIHRWNKAQQDALLPHIENGDISLIGATTENPSFEIRGALLSRCRVLVLNSLDKDALTAVIQRALTDETGLAGLHLTLTDDGLSTLLNLADGDARRALNILEAASLLGAILDKTIIEKAAQQPSLLYDKDGEEHYNLISALHKSLRGSDANAALYWLVRMLESGEDPLYIARRMVRFASEDVGLCNSLALPQAIAAFQACQMLGLPECKIHLAQVVVYLAKCQKSNELYRAYNNCVQDIEASGSLPVPLHLRNAPTGLMKNLGYGGGYKYSPNYDYKEKQEYLPEELKDKKYLK